jgi:hypothetical protein
VFESQYIESKSKGLPWEIKNPIFIQLSGSKFQFWTIWFGRTNGHSVARVTKCKALHSWETGLPDYSWCSISKHEIIFQMLKNYTKWQKYIPNCSAIFQQSIKQTNIFNSKALQNHTQMAITNTRIFHCKNLQNLLKLGFWVWKYTIWQPLKGRTRFCVPSTFESDARPIRGSARCIGAALFRRVPTCRPK